MAVKAMAVKAMAVKVMAVKGIAIKIAAIVDNIWILILRLFYTIIVSW